MPEMQVVILAGGLGTRLRAVAPDTPKALVPVAGRPFIEQQFELLKRNGLRDVLVCVGHFGEKIVRHVGDGARFGVRVSFAYEDPARLMGTGGALVNALPQLQAEFLTLYGDSYLPTDYQRIVRMFRESGRPALMSVFKNDGQWDKSNARVEGGQLVFYSKSAQPGEADYIDYGLSAFSRTVFEGYRNAPMPLDLGLVQERLVREGQMAACIVHERFYEIGKPEGLAELDRLLAHKG